MTRKHDPVTGDFVRTREPWTPDEWNNGYEDADGRFRVYCPDYPGVGDSGYVFRYHVVWWLNTGYAPDYSKGDNIHHINGDRLDDKFENLLLMSHTEHTKYHNPKQWYVLMCEHCGEEFVRDSTKKNARFCSQKCYHTSGRSEEHKQAISEGLRKAVEEGRKRVVDVEIECAMCGEIFVAKSWRNRKYCSQSCAAKARWQ